MATHPNSAAGRTGTTTSARTGTTTPACTGTGMTIEYEKTQMGNSVQMFENL